MPEHLAAFFVGVSRIVTTRWYTITYDEARPLDGYAVRSFGPMGRGLREQRGFADVRAALDDAESSCPNARRVLPFVFARLVGEEPC